MKIWARSVSLSALLWRQPPLHLLGRRLVRQAPARPYDKRRLHCSSRHDGEAAWLRRKDALPSTDTIYALSTAPGRGAIAIIRISGPACLDIYGGLCPNRPFPHPRTATLRKLYDPRSIALSELRILDSGALLIYFPAPTTVTGEDLLELHVHGGPAVVRSVLEAIPACKSSRDRRRAAEYSHIRPAEAGEFTKRAFYNGRLDLTQAEALGDTLAAETEQQRRLAITGSENGLAKRYEEWRTMLLYARGELEALIDFSEDQHFDESPREFVSSITHQITKLKRQLEFYLKNASRGELLRNGINIALLGAPNAGKSSLLNRIVGREAAIVNAEEGTTRDIVDVSVDIGGWLCRLGDMAGLRRTAVTGVVSGLRPIGEVEEEGMRRARERALKSDVVIVLLPIAQSVHEKAPPRLVIDDEVVEAARECDIVGKQIVFVVNKIDLLRNTNEPVVDQQLLSDLHSRFHSAATKPVFAISCKDADPVSPTSTSSDPGNIQLFLRGLTSVFSDMTTAMADPKGTSLSGPEAQSYWSASLSISHRQSIYLQQCLVHLDDFLLRSGSGLPASAFQDAAGSIHLSHHTDNHDDLVGETQQQDDDDSVDIVALAEHLRYAADCIAKITGRGEGGDVEDVLGVVFEK